MFCCVLYVIFDPLTPKFTHFMIKIAISWLFLSHLGLFLMICARNPWISNWNSWWGIDKNKPKWAYFYLFWEKIAHFLANLRDFWEFMIKIALEGYFYRTNIYFLVYFLCKSIFHGFCPKSPNLSPNGLKFAWNL